MSRRRNPLFNSNLDALMDTLTNVVGILIHHSSSSCRSAWGNR